MHGGGAGPEQAAVAGDPECAPRVALRSAVQVTVTFGEVAIEPDAHGEVAVAVGVSREQEAVRGAPARPQQVPGVVRVRVLLPGGRRPGGID